MSKIRNKLPKTPLTNIAISLSGGGYRATSFHLGSLSYLSTKKYFNSSLLERVRILSTVSAGTFAGVKYLTTIKKGGTVADFYKSLYDFLTKCDLVSEALQYLSEEKNWNEQRSRTLINAFAYSYHKHFEDENFGIFWKANPACHVKEMSFNATEFNFGLPFRFQKTERSKLRKKGNEHEFIGNKKIHISEDVAKEIRLADIIAASACFPFGFEPINFPDDFIHDKAILLKDKTLFLDRIVDGETINFPIGLMDGSIDDNQGVDAVVLAEERMRHYPKELQEFCSHDEKAVDLYIISDASSPKIDSYSRVKKDQIRMVGNWNFGSLRYFGILSAFLGINAIFWAFLSSVKIVIISLSVLGTLGILTAAILLIFSLGLTGLTRKLGVPEFVVSRLLHFDKLKLGTLYNLLVNRRKSAMTLVSDVFIKHMRWFNYERVYGDKAWLPRLIMNAIFDFTDIEVEKRKQKYPYFKPEILEPSEDMVAVSTIANSMGTRLWFTPEELEGENNMPNSIIACGQFTICYNLLEYIEKHLKNTKNLNTYNKYEEETRIEIDRLEASLLEDWRKFNEDPYWMVKEWNAKMNKS